MNRVYLSNKKGVKFSFNQSPDTFKVKENSKIKLLKRGDFRLIEVTKVDISTMEMVEYLAEVLKIPSKDIGYAGLKDKHATTIQYITLPKYVNIKKFKNSNRVTLKELGFCANRLRVGQLESNSFEIILQGVDELEYKRVESAFLNIAKVGFANFFGYQRFGVLNDSVKKGQKISEIGKGSSNQNSKILLAAYQAKSFNEWLNKRLEISKAIINLDKNIKLISPTLQKELQRSKSILKLLPGDLGYFYKNGKKSFESINDIAKYTEYFLHKKFKVTGALFGNSVRYSTSIAGKIEREYIDYSFNALRGARRNAWVWAKEAKIKYFSNKEQVVLNFTLPPGSYATVLLEEMLQEELNRA